MKLKEIKIINEAGYTFGIVDNKKYRIDDDYYYDFNGEIKKRSPSDTPEKYYLIAVSDFSDTSNRTYFLFKGREWIYQDSFSVTIFLYIQSEQEAIWNGWLVNDVENKYSYIAENIAEIIKDNNSFINTESNIVYAKASNIPLFKSGFKAEEFDVINKDTLVYLNIKYGLSISEMEESIKTIEKSV